MTWLPQSVPPPRRGRSDDRGSGVVELPVIAVFVFVPLLLLCVFVGRMHAGQGAVESAARHAARTISIARDPAAAVDVAESDAATTVRAGSPRCLDMGMSHTVATDRVTVTITCTVDLSEATLLPVVPGVQTVSATVVEPRDRHRESDGTP
jgi:hypothetical protein